MRRDLLRKGERSRRRPVPFARLHLLLTACDPYRIRRTPGMLVAVGGSSMPFHSTNRFHLAVWVRMRADVRPTRILIRIPKPLAYRPLRAYLHASRPNRQEQPQTPSERGGYTVPTTRDLERRKHHSVTVRELPLTGFRRRINRGYTEPLRNTASHLRILGRGSEALPGGRKD